MEKLIQQIILAKIVEKTQLGVLGKFVFQIKDKKFYVRYKYPHYYGKYDLDEFAEAITETVKKSKIIKETQMTDVGQRPIEVEFSAKNEENMTEFIEELKNIFEKTFKAYLG